MDETWCVACFLWQFGGSENVGSGKYQVEKRVSPLRPSRCERLRSKWGFLGWVVEGGMTGGLHPTLRKMRDGWGTRAFVVSWVWKNLVGLAVYIPPFAKARRMGHPEVSHGVGEDLIRRRACDWATNPLWCARRTLVYKDTGPGRLECGFREPRQWKSRLTGDLETWRLRRRCRSPNY